MREQGLSAVLLEPGASLVYFTGLQWWRSERLTAAVIPAEGEILVVTPFFEEPSVRETLGVPAQVRTWQEHEDPLGLVAGWLRERKLARGAIGIEETVRYFAVEGLQRSLPGVAVRSASGVVRACRMIKSPAEIAVSIIAASIIISCSFKSSFSSSCTSCSSSLSIGASSVLVLSLRGAPASFGPGSASHSHSSSASTR
jgi:Xaa-Pro dipeptidase